MTDPSNCGDEPESVRLLREALIEGENSGESVPFDVDEFLARMRDQRGSLLFAGISDENRLTDNERETYFGRDRTPTEPLDFGE